MSEAYSIGALDFASGIGGALISGAMSNHAAGKQFKYNAWLQKQAAKLNYANSTKLARYNSINVPGYTRTGLERAGYNPLLAVQNGTSGNNATFQGVGTSTVGLPDEAGAVTSGFTAGMQNAQSIRRLQNETKVSEASAFKDRMSAISDQIKNYFLPERERTELNKINTEITNLDMDTMKSNAIINNIEKRLELDKYIADLEAATQKYSADQHKSGVVYNADKLKEIADLHSPSGRSASFKNYSEAVSDVLKGVGSVIHGGSNYENYEDTTSRTVSDKNEVYTRKSKVSGRRKSKR